MAGDFGQIARLNEARASNSSIAWNLKPGMKVLDVACGTGNTSIPAAKTGADVTGLDIAPNLLEQARKRAQVEGLKIEFIEGDAEQLPQADASFDAVISMFGAMFAPRPELVASELLRVCRPGGFVAMGNWTPEGFRRHHVQNHRKALATASGSACARALGRSEDGCGTLLGGSKCGVAEARTTFRIPIQIRPKPSSTSNSISGQPR